MASWTRQLCLDAVRRAVCATILLIFCPFSSTNINAADNDWASCVGSDARLAIIGCTKVIDAGMDEGRPLDRAFLYRGAALAKLGKFTPAIEDFGKAIAINPNLVESYWFRANAYKTLDRLTEALADLDKAISLSSKSSKLFNDRAIVHRKSGELDKAIADLGTAINLDRKNLIAYMNRSFVYRDRREFKKALEDCRAAEKLDPDPANAIEMEAAVAASTCVKQLKSAEKVEKPNAAPVKKPTEKKGDI